MNPELIALAVMTSASAPSLVQEAAAPADMIKCISPDASDMEALGRNLEKETGSSIEAVKDASLQTKLKDLEADVEQLRRDWIKHRNDAAKACEAAKATERRIKRDKAIEAQLGTEASYLSEEIKRHEEEVKKAAEAEKTAAEKKKLFNQRFAFLAASLGKASKELNVKSADAAASEAAGSRSGVPGTASEDPCAFREDDPPGGLVDPHQCRRLASGLGPLRVGDAPVGGRVLQRSGIAAQISNTGTALSYGTSLAIRAGRERQRPVSLGLEVGLITEKGRIAGRSENDEREDVNFGDLELLDAKTSLSLGASISFFPAMGAVERRDQFVKFRKKLEDACAADQADPKPKAPGFCTGEHLARWVFHRHNGQYVHPEHIQTFNEMNWGAGAKEPVFGFGVRGQLGFPNFTYFDVPTTITVDPVTGKETATFDANNLPQRFYDNDPIHDSHVSWGLTGYGFFHQPIDRVSLGETAIASLTYRRDWWRRKIFDDVILCAPAVGTDSPLCRTIDVGDAERFSSLVAGVELRGLYRTNGGIFPPRIGLAPKYTHEFKRGRNAFALPVFVSANDKGSLTGGVELAHEWDGVDINGDPRKSDWLLRIFANTSFSLSGAK